MSAAIEDYGIIGDCESVALVGRNGSIDWLCWPRFDSDACFAALLGTPGNGRWLLAPASAVKKTTLDTGIIPSSLRPGSRLPRGL